MRNEEYAFLLMEDKSLSDVEIVNLSGMLKNTPVDDVPSIIHAVSVLQNADRRFLNQLVKEIYHNGKIGN